ncbi:MAG: hypothetical protein WB507_14340 [Solirubrobacterales bacterium]
MPTPLIEFPANDPERALRFWRGLLGVELAPRGAGAGAGWEATEDGVRSNRRGSAGAADSNSFEDRAAAIRI